MAQDTPHPYAGGGDLADEAVPLKEKTPFGEVKLPPAELVDELDNSQVKPAAADAAQEDEPVMLDFFGDEPFVRSFKLRYPFRWKGLRIDEVEVHQLTVFEMGQVQMSRSDKSSDLYEVYAHMTRVAGSDTRLPAAVLRKMPYVDGNPIVSAAYDFLYPSFPAGGG